MGRAFSIVELVIVVAIIGILAALCMPYLQNQAVEAKETAARDNLRVLRGMIRFYAVHHGDTPPGYEGNDRTIEPTAECFRRQMIVEASYLRRIPANPFNDLDTLCIIGNAEPFPTTATGQYGWIYQAATGTIRIDWSGKDTQGVPYLDY
jgi:prepilin-type N-terminal cleavage/methylation domain-containing protein